MTSPEERFREMEAAVQREYNEIVGEVERRWPGLLDAMNRPVEG